MFTYGTPSPCMNCTPETGRSSYPINCHEHCNKYKQYCEESNNKKLAKQKHKKLENDYYGVRHVGMDKKYTAAEKKYK